MIILGYAGIGKTTLGGQERFIDLDYFDFLDSHGNLNITMYLNVAMQLSKQGYIVLIFAHSDIIIALKANKYFSSDISIIYPSLKLKDIWLNKLAERARNFITTTAPVAINYWYAKQNYISDITNIESLHIQKIELVDLTYDLKNIINNIYTKGSKNEHRF